MKKVITRGSKIGKCNICGIDGNLTEDHVPPKGSIKPERVGIRSLAQSYEVDPGIIQISQNGVKFRSLCSACNNQRLGKKLDPDLNEFSSKIAQIIRNKSNLSLPERFYVKLRPQRIARAVVGHLLAAEIREDMTLPPVSTPMQDSMRQYFLDMNMDFPEDFNLYFWPYRSGCQVILRGVGLAEVMNGAYSVLGDFLKYFPVAFWLTYQASRVITEKMRDREITVRGNGIDDWNRITLGMHEKDTFRPEWPEKLDNGEVLVINDGRCFIAEGASKRKSK